MASSNKSKQQSGTNNNDSEFPDGMKVLVVDQSPVCLKLITTLLRKCRYQATEMNNFAEALTVLKQNKDNFDIILTNVYDKGQINGFKLLEAGIEYDIPVIMISASEDVEIIKKGVDHGARDYLVKPVYLPEIKNIWQHVFRKNVKKFSNKDSNNKNNTEDDQKYTKKKSNKRRIDEGNVKTMEEKKRIRWDQSLHKKFEDAVVQLGGVDKAVPNKILEMMNEEDITREKVASHLQKYRKMIKKNNNFVVDQDDRKKDRQNNNISNFAAAPKQQSGVVGYPILSRHNVLPMNMNAMGGARNVALQHQQLNNQWMLNHTICNQLRPQQLQLGVRPNQVVMQHPLMMHFGRNFVAGNNSVQVNHGIQQQQQQQNHLPHGHALTPHSESVNLAGKQVTDTLVDPNSENVLGNGLVFDEELQNILDEFLK